MSAEEDEKSNSNLISDPISDPISDSNFKDQIQNQTKPFYTVCWEGFINFL